MNGYLRIFIVIAVFFFMGLLRVAPAAATSWKIQPHVPNSKTLGPEISKFMSEGWMPAGLAMDPDKVYVLYSDVPTLKASRFSLAPYKTRDQMVSDIDVMKAKGFSVVGMHYEASIKTYFLLYTDLIAAMGDWVLLASALDARKVSATVQPYLEQGYLPVAITLAGKEFLVLAAKLNGVKVKGWKVAPSTFKGLTKVMDGGLKEGYEPFGLHKRGNDCNTLFVMYETVAVSPESKITAIDSNGSAISSSTTKGGAPGSREPDPAAPLSDEQMHSIMSEFFVQ